MPVTRFVAPGPDVAMQTPGRPVTWVTARAFLDHFGLASLEDLPGIEDLRAAGLLDSRSAVQTLPGGRLAPVEGDSQAEDDSQDRDAADAAENTARADDGTAGHPPATPAAGDLVPQDRS